MANSLETMAPEIIYNVFSFLSYGEVYPLRRVCKKLQTMVNYHIYQQIRSRKEAVVIKLEGSQGKHIELTPSNFDPVHRVIEFKPNQDMLLSLANTSSRQWSAFHRLIKIHFSGWFDSPKQDLQDDHMVNNLSPQDQAMLLYHHQYNASIEKTYELPSWNQTSEIQGDQNRRYVGDKGLILSMSYEKSDYCNQLKNKIAESQAEVHLSTLPYNYNGYKSLSSCSPLPIAPKMNVSWIRVTLDWIVSGMVQHQKQTQIYESSFNQLNESLRKAGCFKYDSLSEPILDYIVQEKAEVSKHLLTYVKSHTHECQTRLSRLQLMLEGSGVDSQVLWKYSFAKSFVVGNGLLCEEDIVRRIQDSEQEWRKKKSSILRKLNHTHTHTTILI